MKSNQTKPSHAKPIQTVLGGKVDLEPPVSEDRTDIPKTLKNSTSFSVILKAKY